MKYIYKLISLVFIVNFMSGCAYLNTYHNEDKNSSTGNTAVDAKQRFLIYGSAPDSTVTKRFEDGQLIEVTGERLIYCAEPSPDAFSAFTASFDLSAVKPEVAEAALRGVFGESTATIGIRTQSIQLLRDAMYRSCEGYLAGGIDKSDFTALQKSYQKSMVTLVAIEQLARAVAPGQVMINTTANRTASQNIVDLKKMLDNATESIVALTVKKAEVDDKLSSAKGSLKDKVKKPDNTNPADFDEAKALCESDSEKENASCKEYFALVSEQKVAESALENEKTVGEKLKDTFEKANNDPNFSVGATASVSYNLKAAQQSTDVSAHVAQTVQSLVSMVYMDDYVQACTRRLARAEAAVEKISGVQISKDNGKINANDFREALKNASGPIQLKFHKLDLQLNEFSESVAIKIKDEAIEEGNKKIASIENNCDKVLEAYASGLQKIIAK